MGLVAYRLALPLNLEKIHNVFHVSMLRRYRSDPSHVVLSETIELRPDLTYEEEPVEILAREVKELRNKKIPLFKVLWRNQKTKEAKIRNYLTKVNFEDEILLGGGEL